MTHADPLLYYRLASDVLECARVAVKASSGGLDRDAKVAVVPAVVSDDVCKQQILVAPAGVYSSSSFPSEDRNQSECTIAPIALQLTVAVRRCAPVVRNVVEAPDAATLDAAAQLLLEDAWRVRNGVACCLAAMDDLDVVIGRLSFLDGSQPVMGFDFTVTLGYNDNCTCDEVTS